MRWWDRIVKWYDAWLDRARQGMIDMENAAHVAKQKFGVVRYEEATDEWIGSCPKCGQETCLNDCVKFSGKPSGITITCLCGIRWAVKQGEIVVPPVTVHVIGDTVRENDSENKRIALWDVLGEGTCGRCGGGPLLMGPRGGMAMNIKCDVCSQKYWISEIREFGAYMIT